MKLRTTKSKGMITLGFRSEQKIDVQLLIDFVYKNQLVSLISALDFRQECGAWQQSVSAEGFGCQSVSLDFYMWRVTDLLVSRTLVGGPSQWTVTCGVLLTYQYRGCVWQSVSMDCYMQRVPELQGLSAEKLYQRAPAGHTKNRHIKRRYIKCILTLDVNQQ